MFWQVTDEISLHEKYLRILYFKRLVIVSTPPYRFRTFYAVVNILLSVKKQGYFVSFST